MKEEIMFRVHSIYWMKRLYKPSMLVILSLLFITTVDVASVVNNLLDSLKASGSAFGFFKDAFTNSLLSVKFVVIAEMVVILTLVKDAFERISLRYNTGTYQ